MAGDAPRHVVVGRLRKPHGLKGEVSLFPITDRPDAVFAEGRSVWVVDLGGEVQEGPLTIERSRGYHREWLLKFAGWDTREPVEPLRGLFLAVPAEEVPAPDSGEVFLHELEGFAVRSEQDEPLGLVTDHFELPQGIMLEVQGPTREFLLPFRKEFVLVVDRDGRRLVVRLPEGLVEG